MTRSAVDAAPAGVEISSTRTEEWTDVLAEQGDRGGAARDTVSALLDSHDAPTAYVLARADGEAVAVGMAVVTGDHVAVFNMRTRETHRRKGHSRRILDALMAYGVQHGAATAFLQVHSANVAAVVLYEQAGFRTQYEYWYRQSAQ
jgi:ribosomal protein S18 acetylase RimI-like enzyme